MTPFPESSEKPRSVCGPAVSTLPDSALWTGPAFLCSTDQPCRVDQPGFEPLLSLTPFPRLLSVNLWKAIVLYIYIYICITVTI